MGLASPNALTLPNISTAAPKLVNQKSTETSSSLAVSMIDLGLACDEDAQFADNPALFVERVFERWVKEKTDGLKLFSPHFTLTDTLGTFGEYDGNSTHRYIAGVSYSLEDAVYFNLKEKIEQIEQTVPGLGQTALSTLYGWLAKSLVAVTPDFLFNLVQYYQWQGEDNEQAFLEMLEEEGEDAIEYPGLITLEAFEKDFPPHVYKPGEIIKKKQLKSLSKHADPLVAQTAKLLLSQPKLKDWHRDRLEYVESLGNGSQCIGYNLVLKWGEGGSGIAEQVCDDWMEDIYNSGISSDLFLAFMSDRNSESAAADLFDSLEKYIKTLAWLERAVLCLATPDH